MAEQPRIHLRQVEAGPMANYVYIIGDPATRKAAVVDPAWNIDGILDLVRRDGYEVDKILITHYHADHLGGDIMGHHIEGAAEMLGKVKAKLYLQKAEAELTRRQVGLSPTDMVVVEGGDTTEVGNLTIKFLHTPGHTPGSQCFLIENNLISGDTLFIGSCGRVDLPGADPAQMYHSLNHTLRNLDDDTVVYPGHAYSSEATSTIGNEKRHNMFMRFRSLDEFLSAMGYSR
jgi:hydroxyacylglutathione hydrolase